ncbi:MAG TPA: tRNA glutamyl-Q(34) synthetase GluQRS [Hyphomicrobiaceae bacterium]|jgi:glutamyl-Q tRNA(Asp) synthetase|nr:tRNA glutamyl-Q(34) synthetase GluQRS [Hyphomicrobiaceae bacterium]
MTPVFRFAPSPNGELHLGHALSALLSFEKARTGGGRFLLRIEDIDVRRVRPEYVAGIFDDLRWLGLTWEEPVLFQSQRMAAYRDAIGRLERLGLLYPCFATRTEIEAASPDGPRDPDGAVLYPGLWKRRPAADIAAHRAAGVPCALRIDMDAAIAAAGERLGGDPLTFVELSEAGVRQTLPARPDQWGDTVLVRKDIPTSYHLAVVVDDAFQGVTHVTRGQDLFAATGVHRLLQVLLGLPEPVYQHHRLVLDETGRKLSKSARDTSLRALRAQGVTPAAVRRLVGIR